MDLITIKRQAIEVPPSQRLTRVRDLKSISLQDHTARIQAVIDDGKANGYPIHHLTWYNREEDEDGNKQSPIVHIELSRMETEEETAARVQRQEAHNQREIKAHQDKLASAARKKELERITGHLTLEQLQALPTIEPEQVFDNHWLP